MDFSIFEQLNYNDIENLYNQNIVDMTYLTWSCADGYNTVNGRVCYVNCSNGPGKSYSCGTSYVACNVNYTYANCRIYRCNITPDGQWCHGYTGNFNN